MNGIIVLIFLALFKELVIGVVVESIIVLDNTENIPDETPIILPFFWPNKILSYFE